jgi:hypothetical protein
MQRRIAIVVLVWLGAVAVSWAGAQGDAYPPLEPDNAGRAVQVMVAGRGKPNAVAW